MKARKWLIDKRKNNKMTQLEVSTQSAISRAHYANIESGQRTPQAKTAQRIAAVLNFDWTIFFEDKQVERKVQNERIASIPKQ